jgi:glycosyltransferase involved in cell wall biosynthesis
MDEPEASSLHVVLLEPYFTGSHRVWAEGWRRASRHRLHLLTQPGTHWRHRMMASAVPMAEELRRHVARLGPPDVVVASDMVDLASFVGLCRDELAGVPSVVYFHENQLTQPVSPNGVGGLRDRHLAWTNWRSLMAADEVWFNSEWQRDSMEDGLVELLAQGPAEDDQTCLLERARPKWKVRPVGCDLAGLLEAAGKRPTEVPEVPLVLWNHRWAHDKGLDVAVRSLRSLADEGMAFELAVVGTDDHHDPVRADRMLEPLGDRVVHRGWLPDPQYRDLLCRADVVLASARQENFGIAVVEAVAAGCVPVVPDALAYPETITDRELRYPPGRLTTQLRQILGDLLRWRERSAALREELSRFDWSVVAPQDDAALDALVAAQHRPTERSPS